MKDYIILFKNHSEYEAYINGDDKILPNVSLCGEEDEMHYEPKPIDYSKKYLTFVALEDGTFTFTPSSSNVISYSTDNGTTWTEGNSVEVNNGDKVLWKGAMTPSSDGIGTFGSTAEFDVQGNAMSLLYGDNFKGQTDLTGKDYALYRLFYDNPKVVNAKNLSLPATTLADYCYGIMFYNCTGLTTAPELSSTTMARYCYVSMFKGCTSLTTAPELPAGTLADCCYEFMFKGCTSLTEAPELPATTLADNCYEYMFQGCTSLTTASELSATTLADYCYNSMFQGCTSLTTAPELPAGTLAQQCYSYMFQGCTSLNYIKAVFTTTPGTNYTKSWVDGVAATGTFVKNMNATWNVSGDSGIPTGWAVELDSFGGDDYGEIDSQ